MFRIARVHSITLALVLAVLFAVSASAASNSVTVPGVADVWLAGQPNGASLSGGDVLPDTAPANSPVLASAGLALTAGSYLTVSASGTTNYNGCTGTSPDGGGCGGAFTTGPADSVSAYDGPPNALIGVFLDASTPSGTAPSALDFSTLAAQGQATISPQLRQVFFIGDGLTGTGSGTAQHFVIPSGATRLYLGSADSWGRNANNTGSFTVVVSDATASPNPIPLPGTALLAITALLAMAAAYFVHRRFHRPA